MPVLSAWFSPRDSMASNPAIQARAKRVDRFMTFAISGGGLLIIGAVLAMLLFILKEAAPLFLPPRVSQASTCLLYTSPSPRDGLLSRMPSSA